MGGIPSHYTVDLDLVSPVDLTGIPSNYHVDIGSLPKIQIGLDPLSVRLDPITVTPLTLNPLDVSVRVKEAPSIRAHVPANFAVEFSVLGLRLACIRVCGEAQVITEPYVPNPCEVCGGGAISSPVPAPPGDVAGVPKAVVRPSVRAKKG